MSETTGVDVRQHNRVAWNREVERKNEWTVPVDSRAIAEARQGRWNILLTPVKPVPREWFPPLNGTEVLCLASGGGQQGPILAAAGARVTVFDNSPAQLGQDRMVAERDSLSIVTVEGDMADLSVFDDDSFDLIVHPVSNTFVADVLPVWTEAFRVLKPGCSLLAGFTNPAVYLFDYELADDEDSLKVVNALPYSDPDDLSLDKKQQFIQDGLPFEFSHTLEDQIGGQCRAGFVITALFEDGYPEGTADPLNKYMPLFIATRAVKPETLKEE